MKPAGKRERYPGDASPDFAAFLARKPDVGQMTQYILHELDTFNLGHNADLSFMTRPHVGAYCRAAGFAPARNWARLELDKIAPKSPLGPNVVPEREAAAVLGLVRYAIDEALIQPKNQGKPQKDIISDFLPKGRRYHRKPTLGLLWEWRYAMAVELEHGRTRGANVTNNHPLLTALVVIAHLSEDKLYYARLWEMETGAELFNAHFEKVPAGPIMEEHIRARGYLQQRLRQKMKLEG